MRALVLIVAMLAVAFAALPSFGADPIAGAARAFRGDILIVHGGKVRLFGIAAPGPREQCPGPDGDWPCGRESKAALNALVAGGEVVCTQVAKVGHGSIQATCLLDGADVAQTLVESGWARAVPEMTDAYVEAEARARDAKRGLWRDGS
jgi:endonuclease YncB( thermonuclease family)